MTSARLISRRLATAARLAAKHKVTSRVEADGSVTFVGLDNADETGPISFSEWRKRKDAGKASRGTHRTPEAGQR
jgi:hypothetical protein